MAGSGTIREARGPLQGARPEVSQVNGAYLSRESLGRPREEWIYFESDRKLLQGFRWEADSGLTWLRHSL